MFIAYELSLELIDALAGIPERIGKHDADLARQIRRSGSGVPLQIAEGNRRRGKDRLHFFRIASGSADEVRATLQVAVKWRYLTPTRSPARCRSAIDCWRSCGA
jgi:four helix bundle protein